MFFARLVPAFLLAMTVVASPAPRADAADVQAVLDTLQATTNSVLPQLNEIAATETGTDENVTPLVNQLADALTVATADLDALNARRKRGEFFKRQSTEDVAAQLASITEDITTTFDALDKSSKPPHHGHIPSLPGHIKIIDGLLSKLLFAVELILAGVLKLVASLLGGLAFLLKNLAFALVLIALALV